MSVGFLSLSLCMFFFSLLHHILNFPHGLHMLFRLGHQTFVQRNNNFSELELWLKFQKKKKGDNPGPIDPLILWYHFRFGKYGYYGLFVSLAIGCSASAAAWLRLMHPKSNLNSATNLQRSYNHLSENLSITPNFRRCLTQISSSSLSNPKLTIISFSQRALYRTRKGEWS